MRYTHSETISNFMHISSIYSCDKFTVCRQCEVILRFSNAICMQSFSRRQHYTHRKPRQCSRVFRISPL